MTAEFRKGRGYDNPFTPLVVDGCAFVTTSERLLYGVDPATRFQARIEVPSQAESGNDEPGPDRNGKRARTPKLPQFNRRNWWNR
jgi:hypothetical protein